MQSSKHHKCNKERNANKPWMKSMPGRRGLAGGTNAGWRAGDRACELQQPNKSKTSIGWCTQVWLFQVELLSLVRFLWSAYLAFCRRNVGDQPPYVHMMESNPFLEFSIPLHTCQPYKAHTFWCNWYDFLGKARACIHQYSLPLSFSPPSQGALMRVWMNKKSAHQGRWRP